MIMKKVVSAMAIVGVLATSGAVMAAPNSTDAGAEASKPKAAVEASAQSQHQYRKGAQAQNLEKAADQVMNKFQHKNQNGGQTQEKSGDCTQDQKQTQTQTQDQLGK
jgi:ribulose 1,5-bisphosphate carboxylase large subunit-like protein